MNRPLASLQEVLSLSQEAHSLTTAADAKIAVLREKIRNADDALVKVIINALLNMAATPPVEVTSKLTPIQAEGRSQKTRRPKEVHELSVAELPLAHRIASVMPPKIPFTAAEVVEHFAQLKTPIVSKNAPHYVGWVLAGNCDKRDSLFRRTARGVYVLRSKRGAAPEEPKPELIPMVVEPRQPKALTQLSVEGARVLFAIYEGGGSFFNGEMGERSGLTGKALTRILRALEAEGILEHKGYAEWKLIGREALEKLLPGDRPALLT